MRVLLVGVLSISVSGVAVAQNAVPASFAVGANVGYYVLGGEDFEPTDNAPGIELYGSLRTSNRVQVGLGGHYSSHGTSTDANLVITGIFVEPRVLLRSGVRSQTFLGVRGGWVHRSIKPAATRFSSSGYSIGLIAGLKRRIVGSLELEASLSLDHVSLANFLGGSGRDTGEVYGVHVGASLPLRGTPR